MKRMPLKTGDEYDALTKWKKFVRFKAGERKKIKQRYNRKERQWLKKSIPEELQEKVFTEEEYPNED